MTKEPSPNQPVQPPAEQSTKVSKTKAMEALRARLAERPDTETLWKIIWDFDLNRADAQNSDRSLALVLGAILEQSVETAILTHCVDLDKTERGRVWGGGEDAAIPFSAKMRLGFAVGIYGPDSRDDLNLIRHIRNLFAHTKSHIGFGTADVHNLCEQIKWIDKMVWGGIMGEKPTSGRKKYVETVRHYFSFFEAGGEKDKPRRYADYQFPDLYA